MYIYIFIHSHWEHVWIIVLFLGCRIIAVLNNHFSGWLTARCDVYSFGVVLLELLTGRHAVDKTKSGVEHNLVDWARPYLGDRRKLFRIMDTKLQGQYPQRAAYTVAILALQCISEAKVRPQMSEVLATLEQLPVTARHSASPTRPEERPISSPMGEGVRSQMVKFPLRHINDSSERFPLWHSYQNSHL